jgi:hypothetical protein
MKCTPRAESDLSAQSDTRPPQQRGLSLPIRLTRRGGAVEPAPLHLTLRCPRGSRFRGKAEAAAPSCHEETPPKAGRADCSDKERVLFNLWLQKEFPCFAAKPSDRETATRLSFACHSPPRHAAQSCSVIASMAGLLCRTGRRSDSAAASARQVCTVSFAG